MSVCVCDACHRGSDQMLEISRSRNQVFEDVQLGPLLGQGGYGKVYRGLWDKTPVAVKVWGVLSVHTLVSTKMRYRICYGQASMA